MPPSGQPSAADSSTSTHGLAGQAQVSLAEFTKLKRKQRYATVRKTIREPGYLLFDDRDGGKRYQDHLRFDDTFTQVVWVEFVNGKLDWKADIPVDDFMADTRASRSRVPSSVVEKVRDQVRSGLR